MHLDQRY